MKKSRLNLLSLLTVVCISLFVTTNGFALTPQSTPSPQQSLFDAWEGEDILQVTIKGDLASVIDNKKVDEYRPVAISWKSSNGKEVNTLAKTKVRGKYRRRVCGFPPLKLKFKKERLANLGYTPEFNTLKLVTHCLDDDKATANQNVLKEYLAYKMYEEISDNSFRTQLVEVTYIDESGTYGTITRYGFFIEKKKELAQRLNGKTFEGFNTPASSFIQQDETNVALFQYMIGNEDWNTSTLKNNALIALSNGQLTTVPYDFDFSGLVKASYARLVPQHGLTAITDRIYLGFPVKNQQLENSINLFISKQAKLIAIIENQTGLSRRTKREAAAYINSFFDILTNMEEANTSDYFFYLKNTNNLEESTTPTAARRMIGEER